MTTDYKITVKLDVTAFELLKSLCQQRVLSPDDIITYALWDLGEKTGMLEDELLTELHGTTIYRVKRVEEILFEFKYRNKEGAISRNVTSQ